MYRGTGFKRPLLIKVTGGRNIKRHRVISYLGVHWLLTYPKILRGHSNIWYETVLVRSERHPFVNVNRHAYTRDKRKIW